jgi:HK97 family phage portal protein
VGWLHSTEQKAIPSGQQGHIVIDPFGGRANMQGMLFPDSSYETFALNGFGRNELVYSCIMYKARNIPQGVLRVYGDVKVEPLEQHRLRRLIAQPNDTTNEVEFLQLSIVHLDLAGNCYWLINRDRDGLPAELWPVRPDLIRIIPSARDPRAWSYGYVLDPTTGAGGRSIDVIPIARRDLIHIKYPNPLDAYFGQAPLRPATRAVTVDNARTDYIDALLRNDAVPRSVVTTQQAIDDKVVERLEQRWSRKFGAANRGRPAFLQAGMDVKVLGLNLKDLEFGDLTGSTEARICMDIGVQPILVGAKVGLDRSTFSNFREAKAAFWEDTGMGLQMLFGGGVRSQLVPEFSGPGRSRIDVRWDNSEVLALQEAATERWDRATNALARGGITRNMFLQTVGLDPVPGGDVFLTPAGVIEQPAGEEPAPTETGPVTLEAAAYVDRFLENASYARKFLAQQPSSNGKVPAQTGRS